MEKEKNKFIIVEIDDIGESKKVVINLDQISSIIPIKEYVEIRLTDGSCFSTYSKLEDYVDIISPIVIKKSGSIDMFNFVKKTL